MTPSRARSSTVARSFRRRSHQVTQFAALAHGLPEAVVYTKFAVISGRLIIPVEDRSGGLWVLEGISR